MTSSTGQRKVQTNAMKAYRKQRQYIYRHCQLCHVTTNYAVIVGVCILMLPMLKLATEHVQLTTTSHINHVRPPHMNFNHNPLELPSLNNVLPAMVLQNQLAWSNIKCSSYASPHSSVCHVALSSGSTIPSGLGRRVVVLLLLLMGGDIETNPGPVGNKLTLDDLGQVMEEVLDVSVQWYHLGVQLKVRPGTLDRIRTQFHDPRDQLLEMLKVWLTTSDNTNWKTLTDALKSRSVGASQLAGVLETKYCLVENSPSPHSSPITGQGDLKSLHCELHPVRDKWFSLGVQLQVPFETLKCIQMENLPMTGLLLEMLTVWLRCTNPPPTWNILTGALESPSVGERLLAQHLRDKYFPQTGRGVTHGYPTQQPSRSITLGQGDLKSLHCELHPVRDKWFSLGVQLQVPIDTLRSIQREYLPMTEQLLEMLTVWLKCINPPPTWNMLTGALESPPVGERLLAQQLRDKYFPQTEGGVTHRYPTHRPSPSNVLPASNITPTQVSEQMVPTQ